jgi:hypothetical protein
VINYKREYEEGNRRLPASKLLLSSCRQQLKPFILGRRTFFRIGKPFAAAYS